MDSHGEGIWSQHYEIIVSINLSFDYHPTYFTQIHHKLNLANVLIKRVIKSGNMRNTSKLFGAMDTHWQ